MKRLLWLAAGLIGALLLLYLVLHDPDFDAFDAQREAWHRRCDAYLDKPVVTPQARDCERELNEMMAYAKRKGWDRR